MRLEGLHHITATTGDAPANVDFYGRLLGLRLVKKTVNQDDPSVYHLFYANHEGSAGADLTFFEYPGARPGVLGAGMAHRIVFRVASVDALTFWHERLSDAEVAVDATDERLRFEDTEGMRLELALDQSGNEPLVAHHPQIPQEFAIQGFDGVRALAADPYVSGDFLEQVLGFEKIDPNSPDAPIGMRGAATAWMARGEDRCGWIAYDPATRRGQQGAGVTHHVAWASRTEELDEWQERVALEGIHPTPVVERFYFQSVYFREPSGVLFELATLGPGFTVDEPLESLGDRVSLPPRFEPLRDRLEQILTPLPSSSELRS